MSLIFVTGIAGAGKSTVLEELRSRGFEAHGTDEDGIAGYYNNETGELLKTWHSPSVRTPEWRTHWTYKMSRDKVEKLAKDSDGRTVFMCGVAANEDEVSDLFSKAIALVIDEDTLEHRINTRTNNTFGQIPHEMEVIKQWQTTAEESYKKLGHIVIDASRPIEAVVDEIVKVTEQT